MEIAHANVGQPIGPAGLGCTGQPNSPILFFDCVRAKDEYSNLKFEIAVKKGERVEQVEGIENISYRAQPTHVPNVTFGSVRPNAKFRGLQNK